MKRVGFFRNNGVKLLITVFFIVTVVCPLVFMLFQMRSVNVAALVTSGQFISGLKNSFLIATVSTLFSISLALVLSFCITKSNIKFKSILSVIFTLPMLIPSISHGMGLILLLGKNGLLTNLFRLEGSIYGFGGIVLGSIMYSFPVAFLMLTDVLKYEDHSTYEAANVLGISKWHQFKSITLPYLRKPLISIVFAVFTMIITDYGVPLMVGGKFTTLPVMMYQEVIGLLNFGKGSVIGAFLLVPAIVAFALDFFNSDKGNITFGAKAAEIKKGKIRDAFSYTVCFITVAFVALPIVAFCLLTFVKKYPVNMMFSFFNIAKAMDLSAGKYLINSIIIALFVSVIGVMVSYATAYLTARSKDINSKILHLASITSLAIPGMVLGLSYVLFFKSTFIYGTMAILVLVNLIHFFASPYLLAYNSFGKLNENLESVGSTLGVSRIFMIKDIFIPQMRSTILEMFSYFFVNSMMTISAVSFLSTVSTMPVALMITQFEAQMLLECSAFISLLILLFNLVIKGTVYMFKRKLAISEDH